MKRKSKTNNQGIKTERGATSLYVVIFTTLLLGIITLSFVRIVLSEASQTSNSDLSQSAYDSALAGVEDAKVALLKYHDCLSRGGASASTECQQIVSSMEDGIRKNSCDVVRDTLGRPSGDNSEEVLIQETVGSTGNESSELEQAYTCVKISEELDDYRSTIGSENSRVRIVPLRTDSIDAVQSVRISWYSDINNSARSLHYMSSGTNLLSNDTYAPPVLSVQFFQAADQFQLIDAYASEDSGDRTNFAAALLSPTTSGGVSSISRSQFTHTNDKTIGSQQLYQVNCQGFNNGAEFACSVNIDLPYPVGGGSRNEGATFLRIGLPYGVPVTDFAVEMFNGTNASSSQVKFTGVQARVDSTGRANDLYRRIETRVELVDVYYPYPEFTIQLGSGDSDVMKKNFYITKNCWYADTSGSSGKTCNNNGTVQ